MATTQEAIARLRMIFETQGADAAVAEMKKLETAETSLGQNSLNLDRAFTNLERRYSETARATADYERAMKTLNAAVAQNPALTERASSIQQTIAARYQATMQAARQAHEAQTALGVGMQAMAAQATAASASTGILGSMLQTFGKGGAAAAIGIGATVLAIRKLDEGVHGTAQYARDIKNFADATGLTTAQVQGLNKEASRFGISTDEMRSGLMRFTSTFDEVRGGGGALLEVIRKIDSDLGEQAVSAANEEEALAVLAAAYRKAGNEFERARLLRAAFGRGGQAMAPLIENLDLGQITDKYAGRGLSEDIIKDLRRLEGEINTIGSNISNKIYSLFAVPWLEAEKTVLKYIEAAAKAAVSRVQGGITPTSDDTQLLLDQQLKLTENAERLEQLLSQPQGKATFAAMRQELEKTKEELKTIDYWLEKLQAAKPGGAMTSGEPPFEARAKDAQSLVQALGGLATVQERVLASTYQLETAYNQLSASGKARINEMREALEALMQVQAEMSQVAPGTYERQLEQIQAIKAEYPGLVAQDAIRMASLADQLRIAQALPGAARMQAEEIARINQLLLEGKDIELAVTIAGKERAVAQAQINSAADQTLAGLRDEYAVASAVTGVQKIEAQAEATYNQLVRQGVSEKKAQAIAEQQRANAIAQVNAGAQQQLLNLQNQHAVVAAVTGAEQMRAQEIATINSLLQQGVSLENATAVAAQQRSNAEAQVNAQIQQQVYKLNEATDLIHAKMADGLSGIIGQNEILVRTQQAYNDAIRQGASEMDALALKTATFNNLLAQRNQQIQAEQSQGGTVPGSVADQDRLYAEAEARRKAEDVRMSGVEAELQELTAAAKAGSALAQAFISQMPTTGALVRNRFLPDIVQQAQQEVKIAQANAPAQQQLVSLQNQYRLGAAATPQEKAQIQAQITYEDLIRQGVQSNLAHQIANQELANAMQDLAKSVDANTTALQDQLDPIYSEGRAALRIGYYGEGSGGTMRTVTGTGYANAPANENAQAGGNLIVINNNFPAGAVMGDRRTQSQAANAYGRAIAATGK